MRRRAYHGQIAETSGPLVFLIAVALVGLVAFGLGWALLGNLANALLVAVAGFGTEFDRFLTGLVIVGPALGLLCMVAAIWLSLGMSGRCKTRGGMLRGTGAALAIVAGIGAAAWARTPSVLSCTRPNTTFPTRMSPLSCVCRSGRKSRRAKPISA